MKCLNCGKGRPILWTKDGGFCCKECLQAYERNKKQKDKEYRTKW